MYGRKAYLTAAVLAGLLHAGEAFGQPRGDWWMGDHPMMWMWGAWGIGMMIVMLLFWAAVIAGIVLGIRWLLGQGRPGRGDAALDILRERYARGEINREEFEQRKRDLLAR
ncbi:MAG: SHOCT domain-containing protein [Candidatus Methylomirabilales bacterium]